MIDGRDTAAINQSSNQYEMYSAHITKRTWVRYIVRNYVVTELVSSCYIVLKAK